MKTILITGGSGLIGGELTKSLQQRGYNVRHLAREKRTRDVEVFTWGIDRQEIESGALQGVDVIIHLAGAGVADKRWTEARKKEILESRTKSTLLLSNELKKGSHNVQSFICASAIGYYGIDCKGEIYKEESGPGSDFLADVTKRWEHITEAINDQAIRVVTIRTGVVLTARGGALQEMARPIKFYVGAPLGSGEQVISWIHIEDHCNIIIKAIEDVQWEGPYNSVAPHPVTNKQFTEAIAKVLGKPLILPNIPSVVLKGLLGEMSSVVLFGCNVSAAKVMDAGFEFKFVKVEDALRDLLKGGGA
ncbi:MAG: TIGR01777 family oxidoreductase [Chryseolinea sp.]